MHHSERVSERYINAIGFLILYPPAYVYRMSIKSTGWLYWPLIYLTFRVRSQNPSALRKRLLTNPMEWWRRILVIFTLTAFYIVNTQAKAWIGPSMLGPLDYIFAFDFASKPWQSLMIVSALITLALATVRATFRAPWSNLNQIRPKWCMSKDLLAVLVG